MKTRVFRSGKGDSLLLTSDIGGNILVDGGVPGAYADHLATFLGRMRDDDERLDLVCVSHIDRDHIGGILELFDNEVAWRLYELWEDLPSHLRPRRRRRPRLRRPADVAAVWHNAFFENVRHGFINAINTDAAMADMEEVLLESALRYSGGSSLELNDPDGTAVTAAAAANRAQFLGQSVGDAIELSRRIGSGQLGIDLNPQYGGEFVLRSNTIFELAGFKIRVLGPTAAELKNLIGTWNDWLRDRASWLKELQRRHDRDERRFADASIDDVLARARDNAIALSGNMRVTPPNLASIIMHVENDGQTILLTGDADDMSIVDGLQTAGLTDADGRAQVDIFKVPHHGAHNSYSDTLAQTVVARHYVFSGNGKDNNPETDVLNWYLEMLFDGRDGHPPSLPSSQRVMFWFNSGPDVGDHETTKLKRHWDKIERLMKKWRNQESRFRYRFMKSGDSFVVD